LFFSKLHIHKQKSESIRFKLKKKIYIRKILSKQHLDEMVFYYYKHRKDMAGRER